jgi:3-oxoacyl-[acyl-carrier protein] reductase
VIDIRADVSKPAETEALLDAARSRLGGLDKGLGPVLDVTEADYDRMYNVNAKGAFFTLQQAARAVNSGGSIVYIGSSSTLRPVAGFGLYASSKLPANYLVGVLAQEIGKRGVTVNAVIAAATDGTGSFTERNDDDPLRALVQNASPLGSRMGTVDDVDTSKCDGARAFLVPCGRFWIPASPNPAVDSVAAPGRAEQAGDLGDGLVTGLDVAHHGAR